VSAAPWRSTTRRCAVSAATEPAGGAAAPGIIGGDPVTISVPLVALVGMVVLVAWRYAGLTAWQAFVCPLAGFLLAATPAALLAVHQSRHDIAEALPRSGGHVPASKPAGPGLPNTQQENRGDQHDPGPHLCECAL
jgi:hypothetical protein